MDPIYKDDWLTILQGDSRLVLQDLPEQSVHCVITSPPYFGLRDYGTAAWDGGDPECDHRHETAHQKQGATSQRAGRSNVDEQRNENFRTTCGKCGARRTDEQIGIEDTPADYVAALVEVFRGVRRVLRDDGTVWLNLGDSYANDSKWGGSTGGKHVDALHGQSGPGRGKRHTGLKSKDLIGIPWRVAFALQEDGWVLRSDIVWSKPNGMPSSVTDRPTTSHEMLFLLSKAKWVGPGSPPIWMSETDKAWLAALIDGEGSICFNRRERPDSEPQVGIRLSVVNTNVDLLRRISEVTRVDGGPGSPSPRYRSTGESNRDVYCWQVTEAKAAAVISAVRPYLIAKAVQADLALAAHAAVQVRRGRGQPRTTNDETAYKLKLADACSDLNHGRETDLSWFEPVALGRWESQPYMYDADAIREPHQPITLERIKYGLNQKHPDGMGIAVPPVRTTQVNGAGDFDTAVVTKGVMGERFANPLGRNKRTVWEVATVPYPDAHYAVFPPKLIEPCIKAGTSEMGVCAECGAPWTRLTEREDEGWDGSKYGERAVDATGGAISGGTARSTLGSSHGALTGKQVTVGWEPTCAHGAGTVPATVLDPFAGSGTVGKVAQGLSRRAVLIDLSTEYLAQQMVRNGQVPLGL